MTNPDAELLARLRALSRAEHDDLSIGDEAADRLEVLRRKLADSLCGCGPYLETDPSKHSESCQYRFEMER